MWLLYFNYRLMRSRFFALVLFMLMFFSFSTEPLFADVVESGKSFRNNSGGIEKCSLIDFFGASKLSERSPFIIERGHYVYRGGELKTSYDLNAPLYIEKDLVVQCRIKADEIILNSKVEIKRTKEEKNTYESRCGLIASKDFKINKKGQLSMERGTFITVGRNLKSASTQSFQLENGTITVQGNITINKNWVSNNNCIIKISGRNKHVLKGDASASVGVLLVTEEALYNTNISKSFWGKKPKLFQVKNFAIKFSDSMIIKDLSTEIDRYLSCEAYRGTPPYYITKFAKMYLYQILYCSGDKYSVDIYDTFFHAKSDGPQANYVALKNEKAFYLDNTRKLHSVTMDITYTGTRMNKSSYSEGFATLKIKDEGVNYEFIFYPRLDNSDKVLDDFVVSLRKGASEVIKDQAKEIVLSQVISDVAEICAPDAFNCEVGTGVCKNINLAKFFDDFKKFYKNWNQMKNGLVLGPNDRTEYSASEEHVNAPNDYHGDESEIGNEKSATNSTDSDSDEIVENVGEDVLKPDKSGDADNGIPDYAINNMLPLVNAQVNFFRHADESEKHVTSCENEHDFWNTFGAYCNSNPFPENNTGSIYSQDGAIVITHSGVIDMGYALFDDFEGVIPDTDFYEYGPISYDEDEDAYHFLPASMHDYIYKEKSEPEYNDDGTITITYLYEESFWPDRDAPETFAYDITFRVNDHVNESSDNPYYYTIISVEDFSGSKKNEVAEESDDESQTDDEYILPDSDKRLLTEEDIDELDEEMLKLARNEIYAKHGRLFNDENIQSYFNTKSWYKGEIPPEEFQQEILSEIEQTNAEFILEYENNKKKDEVYDYVISHLHGLWYSNTMGPDGPVSKILCEGNNFDGEISDIVEYHEGYLVRIVGGYSYYFGKELDSCIFVDGWETTENNTYGTSGYWKPNEEQREEYGD